jgi:polyisoprenoid-binding protein YceI
MSIDHGPWTIVYGPSAGFFNKSFFNSCNFKLSKIVKMKRVPFFAALFFLLCGNMLYGQNYRVVDNASSVKVSIKNAGMEIDGKLTGLEGDIHFNPADLKGSSFSVSIDANTINTGIDVRDENLRGDEYLDTKNFPGSVLYQNRSLR